jgi:hypothetical protein
MKTSGKDDSEEQRRLKASEKYFYKWQNIVRERRIKELMKEKVEEWNLQQVLLEKWRSSIAAANAFQKKPATAGL